MKKIACSLEVFALAALLPLCVALQMNHSTGSSPRPGIFLLDKENKPAGNVPVYVKTRSAHENPSTEPDINLADHPVSMLLIID